MTKKRVTVFFALLLAGLLLLSPATSLIHAEATGEVTVGSVTARPGDVKEITITVKDLPAAVADFVGTLKFDPWVVNVAELVEVNDYTIFASNIDNLKGEVSFVGANYKGTSRKNGAILKLKLLAVGDFTDNNRTSLTLELDSFNDKDGKAIAPTITNGSFDIKNQPPVADFTFSPTRPKVDEAVKFTDQSKDPDGKITAWEWEFGDGATSTEQNPSHAYSQSGKFTVKLTVTDSDGATNAKSKEITVGAEPPKAQFTFSPELPNPNQIVRFTDQSTDPDGTVTAWEWEFGDGATSTERNPTHKYTEKRIYEVTLTVTDNSGLTSQPYKKKIYIGLKPPVAKFAVFPASPRAGKMTRFVSQSTDADGRIVSWEWDFGDGYSSTEKNPKHQYAKEGTYTVKLTVTDNDDITSTATQEVTVSPGPPAVLVRCFPNPAATETTFKYDLPDGTGKATLYVFDITGKLVFHDDLPVTTSEYTWDLRSNEVDLPNGPYFFYVIAYDAEGKFIARSPTGKLVIQRS